MRGSIRSLSCFSKGSGVLSQGEEGQKDERERNVERILRLAEAQDP